MNEMIKAERNKICSRKQTRMLFLAGVVLIVAYFFFFQFNYQNVFYDYDLEKMALASGFTAIEQRKEVAEIFEGKLSHYPTGYHRQPFRYRKCPELQPADQRGPEQ